MNRKRLISIWVMVVYMTFTMVSGFTAEAVTKSTVANKQISLATNYVVKAETYIKTTSYTIKTAQTMASTAKVQVGKIYSYGSAYRNTYNSLIKRVTNITNKINAQVKTNVAGANKAVVAMEALTSVNNSEMVKNNAIITKITNAIKLAKASIAKLDASTDAYVDLKARVDVADENFAKAKAEKVTNDKAVSDKLKAVALQNKLNAQAAVVRAELTTSTNIDKLATGNAMLEYTQKTIATATTAIGKLDKTTNDYKDLLSRVNALNDKIQTKLDKNAADAEVRNNQLALDAAERAVKALENAKLVTDSDFKAASDLEAAGNTAVAKVKDATEVGKFNNRINIVDQNIKALKARLDAAALVLKTPAKVISVSAVDKTITVKFDKKPLATVQLSEMRIALAINGGAVIGIAASAITQVDDTTVSLTVPTIAPLANADQSAVYSVQYNWAVSVSASAFTVAKIPYLMVVSATAINQRQIKVLFNKPVNKISAETISNYLENGYPMNSGYEKAELQSDNVTVIITYVTAKAQQTAITFTVMNVKNDTLVETITSATFSLNFMDTTPPTIKSVVANSNYSITVTFSEPVNNANVTSDYQLDGYDLTYYGVTSIVYDDTVYPTKQDSVTITFGTKLINGAHNFSVLSSRISDYGNYYLIASSTPITVVEDTSKPTVLSAVSTGLGILDITFNKAVQLPSRYYIYVNGVVVDSTAVIQYKDSNTKTVVEIVKTGLLVAGTNLITMSQSTVNDLYGNTNSTAEIRFTVTSTADYSAATVSSISLVSDRQLIVYFTTAMGISATYTGNYVIRDSYGNIVSTIISVVPASSSSYAYYINLGSSLSGGTYTVTVSGPLDISGNLVYSQVKTISSTDTTQPLAPTAALVDSYYKKVQVYFSEAMNYSTILTLSNYKIALAGAAYGYTVLDSSVTITPAYDYKSVTLDFPDSTPIVPGLTVLQTSYLKDTSGNYTYNMIDNNIAISGSSSVIPTFLRARAISPTQVEVEYNKVLSNIAVDDFYLNSSVAAAISSTTATLLSADGLSSLTGTKITLTFPSGILNTTGSGTLSTVSPIGTTDTLGNPIAVGSLTSSIIDKIPPIISSVRQVNSTTIDVTFSENMLSSSGSNFKNDFTVTNGTSNVAINSSQVISGTKVEFTLASALDSTKTTLLKAKTSPSYTMDSNSNLYAPLAADISGLTVSVAAAVVDNPAIGTSDSGKIQVGTDFQATGYTAPTSGQTITWSSDANSVATVGSTTGLVHPVGPGTVNISYTVTDSSSNTVASGSRSVTVYQANTEVDPTYGLVQLGLGNVAQTNITGGTQTWVSENDSIASVSSTGVVTPHTSGTVRISYTITDSGFTVQNGHTDITVYMAAIVDDPVIASIQVGGATTLASSFTSNGPGQSISWSSDNSVVATVTAGVVTPKAEGTANISYVVTDDGSNRIVVKGTGTVNVIRAATNSAPTATFNAISVSGTTNSTTVTEPVTSNQSISWSMANATSGDSATHATLGTPTTNASASAVTLTAVSSTSAGVNVSYVITDNTTHFEVSKGTINITIIP